MTSIRAGYLPKSGERLSRRDSSTLLILRQVKNGLTFNYVQLRWDKSKRSKSLGRLPDTPTGILEACVAAAWRDDFTDEELRQLLRAPKDMRQ